LRFVLGKRKPLRVPKLPGAKKRRLVVRDAMAETLN